MSEDSIKMSNLNMRILFESGLYSNADSICDFTVFEWSNYNCDNCKRHYKLGQGGEIFLLVSNHTYFFREISL